MMNEQEAPHIHLEQCVADLNEAWRLGQVIEGARGNPLAAAAFKYMLIAYARPFRTSRDRDDKPHRLTSSAVPSEYLALHDRLLTARDKVLAHSDFLPRDPQLHVAESTQRRFAIVAQNVVHGAEEMQHLDEIIALIEGTLKLLYRKVEESERALPVTIDTL